MAVNDNDRVTTRRLKQFWDLAKPWIQNLVSGAIDTSEEAMESSMDTKIQAAKPNYNMPNENDQIGVGYGYNETAEFKYSPSGTTFYTTSLFQAMINNDNLLISNAGYRYYHWINRASSSKKRVATTKALFMLCKSLAVIPKDASTDTEFTLLNDYFNWSLYTPPGNIAPSGIVSPVITYNDHTYQYRITPGGSGTSSYDIKCELSINDGSFTQINWNETTMYIIISTDKTEPSIGYIYNGSVDGYKINDGLALGFIYGTSNQRSCYDADGNNLSPVVTKQAVLKTRRTSYNTPHRLLGFALYGNANVIFSQTYFDTNASNPNPVATINSSDNTIHLNNWLTGNFSAFVYYRVGSIIVKEGNDFHYSPVVVYNFTSGNVTLYVVDPDILAYLTGNNSVYIEMTVNTDTGPEFKELTTANP